MRDNDGAFVFAEYDSATKKVTLRVTLLITKRRRVKVQINGVEFSATALEKVLRPRASDFEARHVCVRSGKVIAQGDVRKRSSVRAVHCF